MAIFRQFDSSTPLSALADSFRAQPREVREGVPESVVMKIGGWKTASVFRRYAIVSEDDLTDAFRCLDKKRVRVQEQLRAAENEHNRPLLGTSPEPSKCILVSRINEFQPMGP